MMLFFPPHTSKATLEHASKYLIKEKQLCRGAGVCLGFGEGGWGWEFKMVIVSHGIDSGYSLIKVTCLGVLTFAWQRQDGAGSTLPALGRFGRAGVGAR